MRVFSCSQLDKIIIFAEVSINWDCLIGSCRKMSEWTADVGTTYSSYSVSWMSHNSLFELNQAARCLRLPMQCCPEWTPNCYQLFSASGKSMASYSLWSKDTLWSLFLTLMFGPA